MFTDVYNNFEVHEENIGVCIALILLQLTSFFVAIKDVSFSLNLAIEKCRGQCYDGTCCMSW